MEVMELIKTIPEERMESLIQMVKNFVADNNCKMELSESEIRNRKKMEALRKLLAKEPPLTEEQRKEGQKRAEHLRKCFEEFDKATGGYNPWSSEEEMIEELARDRRERMERMAQ